MKLIDYAKEFRINSSTEKVFTAIMEEVEHWWTNSALPTKIIGDEFLAAFNEEQTLFMKLKVQKIIPRKLVYWSVLDDNLDLEGRIPKGEWVGTIIKWELEEEGDKTKVSFEHQGLNKALVCYEDCENGWNHYLNSFQQYLNTGKGNPSIN